MGLTIKSEVVGEDFCRRLDACRASNVLRNNIANAGTATG